MERTELTKTADAWRTRAVAAAWIGGILWLIVSGLGSRDVFTGEFSVARFLIASAVGGAVIAMWFGVYALATSSLYGLATVMRRLDDIQKDVRQPSRPVSSVSSVTNANARPARAEPDPANSVESASAPGLEDVMARMAQLEAELAEYKAQPAHNAAFVNPLEGMGQPSTTEFPSPVKAPITYEESSLLPTVSSDPVAVAPSAVTEADLAEPAAPAEDTELCLSCFSRNPQGFAFCTSCGAPRSRVSG